MLKKCDIFSLGVTLYHVMNGENYSPCLNGEEWRNLRQDQINLDSIKSRYSQFYLDLILSMLSSNPHDRPGASKIVKLLKVKEIKNRLNQINSTFYLIPS